MIECIISIQTASKNCNDSYAKYILVGHDACASQTHRILKGTPVVYTLFPHKTVYIIYIAKERQFQEYVVKSLCFLASSEE